ncbi:hypothetical protein TELCIR_06871 [Teladorsagia circumcincta]|uniref:Uncharacterized protein n=1 Tax=Teladorsagia circumcincta TaxID=45464 RepID=A0A2G9ULW6_TELCI|nr:hypothetical protein TELCIR_06871 [Teladorsagia circumcincta]
MIAYLALIAALVAEVRSQAGECRSECVELNLYKIDLVHLKEDLVMARVCQNTTVTEGYKSRKVPFICNRHHGIWMFDENVSLRLSSCNYYSLICT